MDTIVDIWTNLAFSPLQVGDVESIAESIREQHPSLTSAYAVLNKDAHRIAGHSFNPHRESPLRSIQFECMGVTFVVSDKVLPGEIWFFKDVYDLDPVAVIKSFSTDRTDYPSW